MLAAIILEVVEWVEEDALMVSLFYYILKIDLLSNHLNKKIKKSYFSFKMSFKFINFDSLILFL